MNPAVAALDDGFVVRGHHDDPRRLEPIECLAYRPRAEIASPPPSCLHEPFLQLATLIRLCDIDESEPRVVIEVFYSPPPLDLRHRR